MKLTEEMLIRYCAPTLAAMKTGSMFTGHFAGCDAMIRELRSLNRRLHVKGLRVLPLRYHDGRALIYLYRPALLTHDLTDALAQAILADCGYDRLLPAHCVGRLIRRLRQNSAFPHEIGLFLGYPPEDVYGFIHRHDACRYTGCWKVYGNVAAAKRTFDRYDRCTSAYLSRHACGIPLEKLTVPGITRH